MQYNRLVTR